MNGGKVSAYLYIGREVLETAKRLGLNVSRVSENALVEAIRKLDGPEAGKEAVGSPGLLVRGVGFGPTNPCGIAASGRNGASRSSLEDEVDWERAQGSGQQGIPALHCPGQVLPRQRVRALFDQWRHVRAGDAERKSAQRSRGAARKHLSSARPWRNGAPNVVLQTSILQNFCKTKL
jgi:hypothetical protein